MVPVMRVIGGSKRGRRLRTAPGLEVRPTSDRLRETLFNVLAPRIEGSRFLDLCAGSGAVGIEALSRGAAGVTFVERAPRVCLTIEKNLSDLDFSFGEDEASRILKTDVLAALRKLAKQSQRFDIIFFDPPYASPLYGQVMHFLGTRLVTTSDAIVVAEHRTSKPPVEAPGGLKLYRSIRQGDSSLSFYSSSTSEETKLAKPGAGAR
jgi:16S rRNA (guanine(966)-N(2))-methyltransferase RsmD